MLTIRYDSNINCHWCAKSLASTQLFAHERDYHLSCTCMDCQLLNFWTLFGPTHPGTDWKFSCVNVWIRFEGGESHRKRNSNQRRNWRTPLYSNFTSITSGSATMISSPTLSISGLMLNTLSAKQLPVESIPTNPLIMYAVMTSPINRTFTANWWFWGIPVW